MLEETGRITTIDGPWAVVTMQKQYGSCANCSGGGCGATLTMRTLQPQHAEVRVFNAIGASIGEQVVIGITEGGFMRAVTLLYGVPLLLLIIGVIMGQWLGAYLAVLDTNLISLIGGILGLMGGLGSIWYLTVRCYLPNTICFPTILRRSDKLTPGGYPYSKTLL